MQSLKYCLPALCLTGLMALSASIASSAELTGVVHDQAGEPAAGVTVKLITVEVGAIQPVACNETTTDEAGEFQVTVPDDWLGYPETYRQELTVLAGSLERGLGGVVVSRYLPLPNEPLAISLKTWTPREVTLIDPDGNPVRDVELKLNALLLPQIMPPRFEAQAQRLIGMLPEADRPPAVRTNADGAARLLLPTRESIGAFEASLGNGVTVNWSVYSDTQPVTAGWPERVQLPQMTSIPVQVTADPAAALSDLSLSASVVSRQPTLPMTSIQHELHVNSSGVATVAGFNDTHLYFRGSSDDYPDWRLDTLYIDTSRIGSDGVQLNFRRGVRVSGKVIDGTGERLADVRLFVMQGLGTESKTTDEEGEFEVIAAPGEQMVVLVSEPGYRGPAPGPESLITVPADTDEFTLPNITATRLLTITGTVRNADRTAAANASVQILSEDPGALRSADRMAQAQTATTDENGVFHLKNVGLTAKIRVAAWTGTAASESLEEIPADRLSEPVEVIISPDSLIPASGRVVDPMGNGIAGVPVRIRHRIHPPATDADRPAGEDIAQVATDGQGRFTVTDLKPWGEYIAVVGDSTSREALSGWESATTRSELLFPEIETSLDTIIRGRVISTAGEPIPAAAIRLLSGTGQSQAVSNNDGDFAIENISGRGPLLIASAAGFLFNGVVLDDPSSEISIVLPGAGETAADPGNLSRPDPFPPLSLEERRSLAVRLFEMLPASDPQIRIRALSALAKVDSAYVLQRLNKLPAGDQAAMRIRQSLAIAIAREQPAEALELVDEIPNSTMRQYVMLSVEPHADLDGDARRALLARIVQDGRGITAAEHRALGMAMVGERLLDLGERESGEALLREAHELARNLAPAAWSGYARGAFAEELAQVDADAALVLIEPLIDDDEYNRHLTNIAHELAPIDPQRAAECLDLMRESQTNYIVKSRDGAVIRVCYRMVRIDPDRAVELAGSIESDVLRVRCLGVMAGSLLAQDEVTADSRARAARILSNAWDILTTYPDSHDQSEVGWLFPSTMSALLLPATADLLPEELPARIWQTIALRRPMVNSGSYRYSGVTCCSEIALLLADIDAVQSQRVAAWLPDEESDKTTFEYFIQGTRTATDLIAILAPDSIERYLAVLEDDDTRHRVTVSFIAALCRTGESRRRAIENDMGFWFPDDEDLGPMD